jgi:aminoglycoside 6-adenylyltransferase
MMSRMVTPVSFDELETRFVEWGGARPDVRAVLVVGSRARVDHPADEWSDLDLAFVTRDAKRYAADASWLRDIGDVWAAYHDHEGVTWHVLFAGGLDAGVAPLPASMVRAARVLLAATRRAPRLRRLLPSAVRARVSGIERDLAAYLGPGVRVLLDKDGQVTRMLGYVPRAGSAKEPPRLETFLAVIDEFWLVAVWNAKHLRRGELWHARTVAGDGRMQQLLTTMIEWHARHVQHADAWDGGRFVEEWADAGTLAELHDVAGRYDAADQWRSMAATVALFCRLARATAGALGYEYPAAAEESVVAWLDACRAGGIP